MKTLTIAAALVAVVVSTSPAVFSADIVHDAEYYVLEAQHGEEWAMQDEELQAKLDALREKYGIPPNIIHIMWDDTAVGEVGIPEIQSVRGFETPNMNTMAEEGINFMRMYTEPACTPTRAAFQTGRYAVRSGMHTVSFPVEYSGMDADEVTIAEVLSSAGYATAFYGKWHLGDTEFSYAHNQGYDEALFTPYNQVPSMWIPQAEVANIITGMYPDLMGEDRYQIDESHWPRGVVWTIEGTKGGKSYEWGPPPDVRNFWDLETESQKRTLEFIDKNVDAGKPFFIAYQPILAAFFPDLREATKSTANKNMLAEALVKLDSFIGELQKHLEAKGIAGNTLVILMADNGPFTHFGPRGMVETLYTGGKGDFTEGGVRVPCIASWPGVI